MITNTKLYINGKDAESVWGLRLDGDQGGYDALTAFRSLKEPVTNKNVTANGAYVVCGTGLVDERTVNVPVHIVANSYSLFRTYRALLEQELRSGALEIQVRRCWEVPSIGNRKEEVEFAATMYFVSMNQYTQFSLVQNKTYNSQNDSWADVEGTGYGIAKFVLSLYEPNDNPTSVLPEPSDEDMIQYVAEMLSLYGRIATEAEVQEIIDDYFEEHPV